TAENPSLAVTPDAQSVVVAVDIGDLTRLAAVDLRQPNRPRTLIDLQASTFSSVDVGPDGSLYVGQATRPSDIWQVTTSGAGMERLNAFPNLRIAPVGL